METASVIKFLQKLVMVACTHAATLTFFACCAFAASVSSTVAITKSYFNTLNSLPFAKPFARASDSEFTVSTFYNHSQKSKSNISEDIKTYDNEALLHAKYGIAIVKRVTLRV